MAAEAEGMNLLSMYGDDEEDEEAFAASSEGGGGEEQEEANKVSSDDNIRNDRLLHPVRDNNTLQMPTPSSPIFPQGGANSKNPRSPLPQPIPSWQQRVAGSQPSFPVSFVFPTLPLAPLPPFSMQEPAVGRRVSRGALTIVDYAHDEAAMSPETEDEEIDGGGNILLGTELQGSVVHSEGTTLVTSQTFIPKRQYDCLQPLDVPEHSKTKSSLAIDCIKAEREVGQANTSAANSSDLQKDDPLQKFLPPAITIKCSEELQEKINKFLAYKRAGKSFNTDMRKKKDYRNPDFLQQAVRYQDIEQIGTCFGTEVFDKSDFFDEIEDVEVSTNVNNELQPLSTTLDPARNGKLNKKSKWDME